MLTLDEELWTMFAAPLPRPDSVVKHYQGTANDHDQSTHAGSRGKGKYKPSEAIASGQVGSFTRLSTDEIAALHAADAEYELNDALRNIAATLVENGLQVWRDPAARVTVSGIIRQGDQGNPWQRVTQQDFDDSVEIIAQLQAGVPNQDLSVTLVGDPKPGEKGRLAEKQAVMGFTVYATDLFGEPRPGWRNATIGKHLSDVTHAIEVSPERARKVLSPDSRHADWQKKAPLAATLAHEWAHVRGFAQAPVGSAELDVYETVGRRASKATPETYPIRRLDHGLAQEQGWTAYALTDPNEGFAEAFAAWALGAGEEFKPMIRWGRTVQNWSDFVTLPDGRIVNIEKQASEPIGIGCTFDPKIGPYLIYEDGTMRAPMLDETEEGDDG